MQKLLIVDGNNLVMRYAATPGLDKMSHAGEPTGGVHGAIKNIIQDIETIKPTHIAVAFDGLGASKEKRKIYPGYKAHRGPMLDSMVGQIEAARNILRAAGIFVYHEPKMDADDVIGTLANSFEMSVLIKSNDKDFFQLVNERISVLRPNMDIWTWRRVKKEILHPKKFASYLALCGDAVDGIPGLLGCGPKSALDILSKQTFSEFLNNPPEKWAARVNAQYNELKAFKKLTTISKDCLPPARLKQIEPLLEPRKYSKELFPLLRSKNLRSLETWFNSHRPSVLQKGNSIFEAIGRKPVK